MPRDPDPGPHGSLWAGIGAAGAGGAPTWGVLKLRVRTEPGSEAQGLGHAPCGVTGRGANREGSAALTGPGGPCWRESCQGVGPRLGGKTAQGLRQGCWRDAWPAGCTSGSSPDRKPGSRTSAGREVTAPASKGPPLLPEARPPQPAFQWSRPPAGWHLPGSSAVASSRAPERRRHGVAAQGTHQHPSCSPRQEHPSGR